MSGYDEELPWLLRDKDGLLHVDDDYPDVYKIEVRWAVCEQYERDRIPPPPVYLGLAKCAGDAVTCLACLSERRSR
jgi:hypothetical protein